MATPPSADAPDSARGNDPAEQLNRVLLAAIGLAVLFVAIVLVVATTLTGAEPAASAEQKGAQHSSKLPAHYTVRKGDSYGSISRKIGVSVEQLEKSNPYVNPATIRPGQRLKLRPKPPKRKTTGPIFHKVRKGESFGSIAFRRGTSVPRLKALNPKLEDKALQSGDRVRLRR